MALNVNTMHTGLNNPPRPTAPEAIEDFAEAYKVWFSESTGLLTGATADAALDAAKAKMVLALPFDFTNPTGFVMMQTGITDFWSIISTSAAVLFTAAVSATPPTLLTGIPAALGLLDQANRPTLTNSDAMLEIAGVFHTNSLGGFWNLPASDYRS